MAGPKVALVEGTQENHNDRHAKQSENENDQRIKKVNRLKTKLRLSFTKEYLQHTTLTVQYNIYSMYCTSRCVDMSTAIGGPKVALVEGTQENHNDRHAKQPENVNDQHIKK